MLCLLMLQPAFGLHTKTVSSENPMRKIISMLQDMQKEVEREGVAEKEIFDKALCACENGEEELDKTIAESAQLTQEVADHKTSAAQATSDLGEATMLREKEYKQFLANEKDSKTNLASLGKAIPAIEK